MSVSRQVRCVMAQLNLVVGDVDGNTSRIVAAANEARDRFRADLVMLPELAVSGYPPEDLLFHSGMRLQVANSLERLKQEVRGITLIAGYPEYSEAKIFNSAIVIRDGKVLANHRKACLPNYRVFDEKRQNPLHRDRRFDPKTLFSGISGFKEALSRRKCVVRLHPGAAHAGARQ